MFPYSLIFLGLLGLSLGSGLQAQSCPELFVAQGGVFGGTPSQRASVQVLDWCGTGRQVRSLDTIGTTSVQDFLFSPAGQTAYLAAQDSLIKYDLQRFSRVAVAAFGAPSTIKLGLWGDKLLVGNWYEPFGHTGPYTRHLLLYDTATLALVDSIPDLLFGAKDFLIFGDTAYITQNANDANFQDTLGYLAVVYLPSRQVIRRDTLGNQGEDLGRLLRWSDSLIIAFNKTSQTVTHYNRYTSQYSTAAANVQLDVRGLGEGAVRYGNLAYLPYDGALGSYDPIQRQALTANLFAHQAQGFTRGFAWTIDSSGLEPEFYLARINFGDQSQNQGYRLNAQGQVLDSFALGLSPEVLRIRRAQLPSSVQTSLQASNLQVFPNPASQYLEVRSAQALGQWQLFDLSGRLRLQGQSAEYQTQINLQDLEPGCYFWRSEGEVAPHRIIKL